MHHGSRARTAGIAATIALTIGFAACGSDAKSSETTSAKTPASTTSPTEDTTAATPGPTEQTTPATEEPTPTTSRQTTTIEQATSSSAGGPTTTSRSSTATATMPADWVDYTPPEADFTVSFPQQPTTQTQDAPLPGGGTLPLAISSAQDGQRYFATARGEYPAGSTLDPATSLQGAQDQAIANVNGTLIASEDITLQGRPGRLFSAGVTSNGVKGTVVQRVFLDDLTIYENIVVGPGSIDATDEDVAAFFGSFTFTS